MCANVRECPAITQFDFGQTVADAPSLVEQVGALGKQARDGVLEGVGAGGTDGVWHATMVSKPSNLRRIAVGEFAT